MKTVSRSAREINPAGTMQKVKTWERGHLARMFSQAKDWRARRPRSQVTQSYSPMESSAACTNSPLA
jgi:hypothetical protein